MCCGLSGFVGVASEDKVKQLMLIFGLADGIDDRGGHAAGYVSITGGNGGDLRYARKTGVWTKARMRFLEGAVGDICMMHSRYATCGDKNLASNAHPFAIKRGGRVRLWGAHNGAVPDSWDSAKKNGRTISVDSEEIFNLLADKDYKGIQDMAGYGVITWIDSDHRDYVNLARLSESSEICAASIKGGGVVWASTQKILERGLQTSDLEIDNNYQLDKIGQVYQIRSEGIFYTDITGVQLGSYTKWSKYKSFTGYQHTGSSYAMGGGDQSSKILAKNNASASDKKYDPYVDGVWRQYVD